MKLFFGLFASLFVITSCASTNVSIKDDNITIANQDLRSMVYGSCFQAIKGINMEICSCVEKGMVRRFRSEDNMTPPQMQKLGSIYFGEAMNECVVAWKDKQLEEAIKSGKGGETASNSEERLDEQAKSRQKVGG